MSKVGNMDNEGMKRGSAINLHASMLSKYSVLVVLQPVMECGRQTWGDHD